MKKLIVIYWIFLNLFYQTLLGQVPNAMNYQGVFRLNSLPVSGNKIIELSLTIIKEGKEVYKELHKELQTRDGQFNVKIGHGAAQIGDFATLDWQTGVYMLKTEFRVLPKAEFIDMGTTQLVSVPFAFMARNSSGWKNEGDTILISDFKHVSIGVEDPGDRFSVSGGIGIISNSPYLKMSDKGQEFKLIVENGRLRIKSEFVENDLFSVSSFGNARINNSISIFDETNLGTILYSNNRFILTRTLEAPTLLTDTVFSNYNRVNGWTSTNVLEITGGSDITELFNSIEKLEPGDVVCIDPKHSNYVVKSLKTYDKKVIGVVSGADGIKSGLQLSQKGKLDGNTEVALFGRVKVKVVGKIMPGDLLTTSNIPGYSMKYKKNKIKGSIIGKALSQKDENNMALILISGF